MPQSKTPHSPHEVTFLLDKVNNWLEQHLRACGKFISNSKYSFKISHDPEEVADQDIVFILGYTKILSTDFLKKNRLNVVSHESDLPLGKGFAPVQWQILEGKNEIPICLIEASNPVDSGDVLFRSSFTLTGYELYDEIRLRQATETFQVISDFLGAYPNITRQKQIGRDSFYPKRSRKDGELNIDKSLREQFNLLRIGNNNEWPSHFCIDGHKYFLKIFSSE